MKHRRPLLTAGAVVALTALVTGCSGDSDGQTPEDAAQRLTIVLDTDANSFDPPDVGDNPRSQFLQPVYDTLTELQPDASVGPRLATEWEYVDESRTLLRMTLRDDVVFSDGTPFDSDVVKANLEHFLAGTGPAVRNVSVITGITAVDPTTVELQLSAPNPALLRYFGQTAGMMVSPSVLDADSLDTTPVGSGPYLLDASTVAGSQYVYTRNPDYWDADAYPYESIQITPIVDITARTSALRTGQGNTGRITTKVAAEAESGGLDVAYFPSGDVMGVDLFDREGALSPALADPRVRQALNHAIDRDAIVKALFDGRGTPTTQVFNPDSSAWSTDLDDAYPYDPERARELLAEAGHSDDVVIQIPEYSGISDLLAALIQQLGDVGVTVEPVKVPDPQANTEMRSGKYPAALVQLQSNDPWQTIQLMLEPDSAWNALQSTAPELTDAVTAAQNATGDNRDEAYAAVNEYVVDQAWFVPIVFVDTVWATDSSTELTPYTYSVIPPIEAYAPKA